MAKQIEDHHSKDQDIPWHANQLRGRVQIASRQPAQMGQE